MGYWTIIFLVFCFAAKGIANKIDDGDINYGDTTSLSFEAIDELPEESIKTLLTQSSFKKRSLWPSRESVIFIADIHINFHVYDRNDMDNPHSLKFDSTDSSKFIEKDLKTVIFIHGWKTKDNFVDSLKSAYLALDDQKINLIGVDWKKGASNPTYFPSANRVSSVGKTVAKFIDINRKNINLDKLLIIGHSLGAHAAGFVGKTLQQDFKLTAPEIVGLDPAGIGFQGKKGKLQPEDARDVVVFHSTNSLGHFEPLGTVDIYINGGKEQPGLTRSQSHKFSKTFYKDLISGTAALTGYLYTTFDDVKAGKIPNDVKIKLFHGEPFPPKGSLIYVSTQDQSQPKPVMQSTKSKKFSVTKMKSFKRIFSIRVDA